MPEKSSCEREDAPHERSVDPRAKPHSCPMDDVQENPTGSSVGPAGTAQGNSPQPAQHTKLPPIDVVVGREYLGSSPRRHAWSRANGVCKSSAIHPTKFAIQRRDFRAKLEQILATPNTRSRTAIGSTMDFNSFNTGNMGFNPMMNMMFMNPLGEMPPTPFSSGMATATYETGNMKFEIQSIKNSTFMHNKEIRQLSGSVAELVKMNVDMLKSMKTLEARVQRQEVIIARIDAVTEENEMMRRVLTENGIEVPGHQHSHSPSAKPFDDRGLAFGGAKDDTPDYAQFLRDYTPLDNNALLRSNTPTNKITTGSPNKTPNSKHGKNGGTKSLGMLQKRKVHNGTSMLVPPFTFIPLVPLTDKEIVVYFFNSLSRPVVSIRLYARGWGPSKIVETLNAHRDIDPPYLRNTCSVKCTTAQKRGLEKWGAEWDASMRETFSNIDDAEATRLMDIEKDECEEPVDVDVLELLKGLKKHAEPDMESDNPEYGIFTRCVMWCEENKRSCLMSKVHEVARALEEGTEHLLGNEFSVRQAAEDPTPGPSGDQLQTRLEETFDDGHPMFPEGIHRDGDHDHETALFDLE